jgi:hypothetical protein
MLPSAYEVPAAIVLVLGGALACFAGYRLFRLVLGIYGFILGAVLASSLVGAGSAGGMIVAALVGGVVGAVILIFAYFVGIALVGAALAALLAHAVWAQVASADPPALLVVLISVAGAIGAMLLQRYVIVVGTAFAGAWTIILGATALAGGRLGDGAREGDVWILYPLSPAPGERWLPLVWVALGLIGTAVQLALTGKNNKRK